MAGNILVPNERGVLVPQVYAEENSLGDLSETEQVLTLAANKGGSGLGMSYYGLASRCGRRARLSAERNAHFAERPTPTLPSTQHHFVVGSVYHLLHELLRKQESSPPITLDYNEAFKNPNVAEGIRLYKGWLRFWGKDFWGKCIAVEEGLRDETTFGVPVTGALDMVVEMDQAACDRAKRRGLDLQPGRRICDWKTSDAPGDGTQYKEGLQAIWYPYLWNLHHPDKPVDGIIFDCINKRSRRKDRTVLAEDFQAHYAPYGMEDVEVLRGLITQGHHNVVNDIPNRSECVTFRGDTCPYRLNGACDAK